MNHLYKLCTRDLYYIKFLVKGEMSLPMLLTYPPQNYFIFKNLSFIRDSIYHLFAPYLSVFNNQISEVIPKNNKDLQTQVKRLKEISPISKKKVYRAFSKYYPIEDVKKDESSNVLLIDDCFNLTDDQKLLLIGFLVIPKDLKDKNFFTIWAENLHGFDENIFYLDIILMYLIDTIKFDEAAMFITYYMAKNKFVDCDISKITFTSEKLLRRCHRLHCSLEASIHHICWLTYILGLSLDKNKIVKNWLNPTLLYGIFMGKYNRENLGFTDDELDACSRMENFIQKIIPQRTQNATKGKTKGVVKMKPVAQKSTSIVLQNSFAGLTLE